MFANINRTQLQMPCFATDVCHIHSLDHLLPPKALATKGFSDSGVVYTEGYARIHTNLKGADFQCQKVSGPLGPDQKV